MERIRLAYRVLRGHPVMYRMNIRGAVNIEPMSSVSIVGCQVTLSEPIAIPSDARILG